MRSKVKLQKAGNRKSTGMQMHWTLKIFDSRMKLIKFQFFSLSVEHLMSFGLYSLPSP